MAGSEDVPASDMLEEARRGETLSAGRQKAWRMEYLGWAEVSSEVCRKFGQKQMYELSG